MAYVEIRKSGTVVKRREVSQGMVRGGMGVWVDGM